MDRFGTPCGVGPPLVCGINERFSCRAFVEMASAFDDFHGAVHQGMQARTWSVSERVQGNSAMSV